MADPNDIEAAPGGVQTRKSHPDIHHEAIQEAALEPPQNPENVKADAPRANEVDKVIVFSFRGLQLRRIAELQDNLLRLAVTSIHLPTANVSNFNESNASPSTTDAAPVPVQEDTKTIDDALSAYAKALRNYETLSSNALPRIPIGARLIGAMDTHGVVYELKMHPMQRVLAYMLGSSGFDEVMELWEELHPKSVARLNHLELMLCGESGEDDEFAPSHVGNVLEATGGDLGFGELDKKGREQ